jgi:hypothetical protein
MPDSFVNASKIGWIRKGWRYEYTLTSFEKALLANSVKISGTILKRAKLYKGIYRTHKVKCKSKQE